MQVLESALESCIEQQDIGTQAISLTGNGAREWRYYTSDPQKFMHALNSGLREQGPFPIDLQLFQDPDWLALAEFVGIKT